MALYSHNLVVGAGVSAFGADPFGRKARHASFSNAILPLALRQPSAPATGWGSLPISLV